MQHIRFFRYIDVVARTGSIRRAAEVLNVASSAVNRRILDIEEELGTQLFDRLPRGVRLSHAGELFVNYIRRQTAELERVSSEIEDLRGVRRGVVRVATIEGLAVQFLPREMQVFRQLHPKVRFHTTICGREDVLRHLHEFEADIGLVFNPPADPDIRGLAEMQLRLCALVTPDHPLTRKDKVRLSDCLAYPLALPDMSMGGRLLLNDYLARSSLKLDVALESNSYEMMKAFARFSGGVCFQISLGVAQGGDSNDLVALPLQDRGLASGRLVLCMSRSRPLPVATARFVEQLRNAFEATVDRMT